jgi:hypothetical protein
MAQRSRPKAGAQQPNDGPYKEMTMNVWRPLAILSTSALVLVAGYQAASAHSSDRSPTLRGDFRRMRAALENLRSAREHLLNSEHNHGGWRERAIESTDRAIHETEEAMRWSP